MNRLRAEACGACGECLTSKDTGHLYRGMVICGFCNDRVQKAQTYFMGSEHVGEILNHISRTGVDHE